jgi:hypothetical protein
MRTHQDMKDEELLQAISLLQSIKDAYEEACRKIDSQFFHPGRSVYRLQEYKMKENCLEWDKVIVLIREAIPQSNVEKIKRTSNFVKLGEYNDLVNFLFRILSESKKNEIAYLDIGPDEFKLEDPPDYTFLYVLGVIILLAIIEYAIWESLWIIVIIIFIFFSAIGQR